MSEWLESTQDYMFNKGATRRPSPWNVPCPECGAMTGFICSTWHEPICPDRHALWVAIGRKRIESNDEAWPLLRLMWKAARE